jgi:hypothetical protein
VSPLPLARALRREHKRPPALEAQKYFHEIEGLFPNQLQAIVLDQTGARLVLSPAADVPRSPPLYLRICGPDGCQRFVTFSGQQIRVNGEACEVLVDRRGRVLLVGRDTVWSGSDPSGKTGPYRIERPPSQKPPEPTGAQSSSSAQTKG